MSTEKTALNATSSRQLPTNTIDKVVMLEGVLTDAATGGPSDSESYERLRRQLMDDPVIRDLLPRFVRTCRNLSTFWPYIKQEAGTWAERRQIIGDAFSPVMDHLEGWSGTPGDATASNTIRAFDADSINAIWAKALARRSTDPEGAITIARTLLETVTKTILEEVGEEYSDRDDLPKLYARTAQALNLAPNQHTQEPIKAILGGAMSMVNGIGTLRNRLSDSHGHGARLPVKPSPRHASLAVNTAGALASFLLETHQEHKT